MADPRLIDLPLEGGDEPDAAFFFDPAEPESWLAAERVIRTLGAPAPWVPIALRGQGDAPSVGRDGLHPVARADCPPDGHPPALTESEVSSIADQRGLLPFRPSAAWAEGESVFSTEAVLGCTYAKQAGKVVAFSLALMRQIWCAGRDPRDLTTILLAGAAAEIHPNAIEKALTLKSLRAELERTSDKAIACGVTATPSIRVGDAIFVGDRGLDEAAAKIRG